MELLGALLLGMFVGFGFGWIARLILKHRPPVRVVSVRIKTRVEDLP